VSDDPEPFAWYLDRYEGPTGALLRTPLAEFPFVIGRRPGLGLTLPSPEVSQLHAEILRDGAGLEVRDLGSTNGTFVNRRPVAGRAALVPGDVLHVADLELQVVRERGQVPAAPRGTLRIEALDLPRRFVGFRDELLGLIAAGAVTPRFEPIVRLADGAVVAWEALTRGTSTELPPEPARLFAAAAEVGLAADLSRLCRERAVAAAGDELPPGTALFLNCHPAEMAGSEALVASMARLRDAAGGRRLVLEIHETAVTDPAAMGALKAHLGEHGIGLAYDDFGAGQARLLELAEAPPDHLKFDRLLVTGLDRAAPSRRHLLETLVTLARDLGIATVAEGVETAGELDACRNAGFTSAQGYYLSGRGETAPG